MGNGWGYYNLGKLYEKGTAIPQDYNKALEYFQKAGDLGVSRGYYKVALMYKNAQGVPKDYSKAFEFFQKAVKIGSDEAYEHLKKMYEKCLEGWSKNGDSLTISSFSNNAFKKI
ncbi:hypothetical protein NHP190002_06570 [Helicobacter ailurogastricus]|uniref:tetratricopeptide repeat protein n=1 Tax=Helicobacter ailurogastricus TaxID=1578720 RepID=UPI00244D846C|nr:tetratricopeptide repeat protein [Helicobacter ailurogastricus]GMB89976.1 hypothetical protein NHP190002_06570 [Helicobacter ailurogastricus]